MLLLIGDLVGSQNGTLTRAPAPFTADLAKAERSPHKAATPAPGQLTWLFRQTRLAPML